MQVVQEVSLRRDLLGVLPPITVCPLPGFNLSTLDIVGSQSFENFCSQDQWEDPKACIDSMRCKPSFFPVSEE